MQCYTGDGVHRDTPLVESVEHEAYGYDFPDVHTRIEMLDEGVQVVEKTFTADEPTFRGCTRGP